VADDVTPEQRQQAIDTLTEAMVQLGIPEDEAADLAGPSVDEAIRRGVYKQES
jgi:hypothetical protein